MTIELLDLHPAPADLQRLVEEGLRSSAPGSCRPGCCTTTKAHGCSLRSVNNPNTA